MFGLESSHIPHICWSSARLEGFEPTTFDPNPDQLQPMMRPLNKVAKCITLDLSASGKNAVL